MIENYGGNVLLLYLIGSQANILIAYHKGVVLFSPIITRCLPWCTGKCVPG
jgi:hypothetical protein